MKYRFQLHNIKREVSARAFVLNRKRESLLPQDAQIVYVIHDEIRDIEIIIFETDYVQEKLKEKNLSWEPGILPFKIFPHSDYGPWVYDGDEEKGEKK